MSKWEARRAPLGLAFGLALPIRPQSRQRTGAKQGTPWMTRTWWRTWTTEPVAGRAESKDRKEHDLPLAASLVPVLADHIDRFPPVPAALPWKVPETTL